MVRLIMAGLLVGWALAAPPVSGALPQTCPPTCDQIPGSAWPAPQTLPLAAPALARLAQPVQNPRFFFEELCQTPQPADDPRRYVVAARAEVAAPPGQWQLRAQVLHWRGPTWLGGELAGTVFDQAVQTMRGCRAPGYSPSLTTDDGLRMAAVISGPQLVRQYLVAHPQSSSMAELVFWMPPPPAGSPAAAWPPVPDARVLDALTAPLCAAYLSSCG